MKNVVFHHPNIRRNEEKHCLYHFIYSLWMEMKIQYISIWYYISHISYVISLSFSLIRDSDYWANLYLWAVNRRLQPLLYFIIYIFYSKWQKIVTYSSERIMSKRLPEQETLSINIRKCLPSSLLLSTDPGWGKNRTYFYSLAERWQVCLPWLGKAIIEHYVLAETLI